MPMAPQFWLPSASSSDADDSDLSDDREPFALAATRSLDVMAGALVFLEPRSRESLAAVATKSLDVLAGVQSKSWLKSFSSPFLQQPVMVSVIAPGAGTGVHAETYSRLGRLPGMKVELKGQARAMYDRYPLGWSNGFPAPNLESFAGDLLAQGVVDRSDCLILGSRGGQVVLPCLWRARGRDVPPAVVINGGMAMRGLPSSIPWPDTAVTFLLLGAQDYFRHDLSPAQYVAEAKCRVPQLNATTAILFVNEMGHMPQRDLLSGILHHMVTAVIEWRSSDIAAHAQLDEILSNLVRRGFSGRLLYTSAPAVWEEFGFDRSGVTRR